jgi:hypothetical protein
MSKTRRFITFVGMTLVVGSMSTSAFSVSKHTARTASSTAGTGQVRMMDRDRNGAVSKGEFLQYMSQTFHRRDVNKSGQLEARDGCGSKGAILMVRRAGVVRHSVAGV